MKISQEQISFNAFITFYFWPWEQSSNNDGQPYLHGLLCLKLLSPIESTFTPWNFSFLGALHLVLVFGGFFGGFLLGLGFFYCWGFFAVVVGFFQHGNEILNTQRFWHLQDCASPLSDDMLIHCKVTVLIFVSIRASAVVKLFWKTISTYNIKM